MASESFNQSESDSRQVFDANPTTDFVSEISSLEMDMSVADRFEGHLYHVLPSGLKVIIKFMLPVLFNDFMGLLEKEFDTSSCTLNDKFSVTSHIQGRKVTIRV